MAEGSVCRSGCGEPAPIEAVPKPTRTQARVLEQSHYFYKKGLIAIGFNSAV
jgi:hypothetical protein